MPRQKIQKFKKIKSCEKLCFMNVSQVGPGNLKFFYKACANNFFYSCKEMFFIKVSQISPGNLNFFYKACANFFRYDWMGFSLMKSS